MTNNTLSGTKNHESTEPESRQTAKMFFFLLELIMYSEIPGCLEKWLNLAVGQLSKPKKCH